MPPSDLELNMHSPLGYAAAVIVTGIFVAGVTLYWLIASIILPNITTIVQHIPGR
jgi:hypothetical protein